jgi:hypothetical protein
VPDPAAALRHLQKAIGYDALTFENADLRERLEAAEGREHTVVADALSRATAYQRRAHRAEEFLGDLAPIRLLGRLPEYHALMEKALTDFDGEVAAIKRELRAG